MLRILLLLMLAFMAYRIFKNIKVMTTTRPKSPTPTPATRTSTTPGELVPCAKCGIFVLKSNAILRDTDYYCSEHCMNK